MVVPHFKWSWKDEPVFKNEKSEEGEKRSDFTESRWQSSVGGISEPCSWEEATDALEQETTDSASLATNVGTTRTSFDIQRTLHREVGGDNATGVSLSLAQTHSTTISLEELLPSTQC